MGTRSIIMVTGKGEHGEGHETVRLYRHFDGDPQWNLPAIIAGIKRAEALVGEWNSRSFNQGRQVTLADVRAKVFADCIIASSISWYRGFDIDLDEDARSGEPNQPAIFRGPLTLEHCGNQGDLEWMYVVDITAKSVKVYGKGSCPEDLLKEGLTDPGDHAECFRKELVERKAKYREEVNAHVDHLLDMGWDVNDRNVAKKRRRPRNSVAK